MANIAPGSQSFCLPTGSLSKSLYRYYLEDNDVTSLSQTHLPLRLRVPPAENASSQGIRSVVRTVG